MFPFSRPSQTWLHPCTLKIKGRVNLMGVSPPWKASPAECCERLGLHVHLILSHRGRQPAGYPPWPRVLMIVVCLCLCFFLCVYVQEDGALILEGLLNIYWGLRRPIRLQMYDDNERFRFKRYDKLIQLYIAGTQWSQTSRWHSHCLRDYYFFPLQLRKLLYQMTGFCLLALAKMDILIISDMQEA